jgi:hypothetical protein
MGYFNEKLQVNQQDYDCSDKLGISCIDMALYREDKILTEEREPYG